MTRTAILHADDVGMRHGSNAAFIALARVGAIDWGSLMVPAPGSPRLRMRRPRTPHPIPACT